MNAQVENVRADHSVYEFLHRMEVQKVLVSYHGTVLPMSRNKVAGYIKELYQKRDRLTSTDRELLNIYVLEFAYDLKLDTSRNTQLLGDGEFGQRFRDIVTHKQKYLYSWYDDEGNSIFIDWMVSYENRSRSGDLNQNLNIGETGGRVRGSIGNRVGFYLYGTNMIVNGSRAFASEDYKIIHSHSFRRSGKDYAEEIYGYIRFQTDWFGLQIGRERLLWNENYGNSLTLTHAAPMFNFIRLDASYGVVNYNFVHGWILSSREMVVFDPDYSPMPEYDPKYFVGSRIEFSLFRNILQLGFNQSVVYSRSSPDIGYLNPVNFLEGTERNSGERDAVKLGMDIGFRPIRNLEIKTGILFDNIEGDQSFTRHWNNRWAVHGGMYIVNPFGLDNIDLKIDYTRIEPYFYSHHRSPDLYYAHDEFILGHPLGPNADDTLVRLVYRPQWQWRLGLEFQRERHGDNVIDDSGNIITNVGGDFKLPWRSNVDSPVKRFLAGVRNENYYYRANLKYEVFKQIIFGGSIEYSQMSVDNNETNNVTFTIGIWVDY
jgi:hypothetical protein